MFDARRCRSLAISLGVAGIAVSITERARAADAEITSETTAQFYDVRGPTGEIVLPRRRLTTTLGVAAYDLMPQPATPLLTDRPNRENGELVFRARLRYDADYGANAGEASPSDSDRFVAGFSRGPADLMYGYVEGRRMLGGWFGFKLGRQYTTDALGWWSFDGGTVRLSTPQYFAVEAFGGLEVRGGMPLARSRWEADGMWRGDRSGLDATVYPSFQPNAVAPAFGAAVESTGVTWLHARLSYRRVYNTGSSNVSQFASGLTQPVLYDGTRISQERLGYALEATAGNIGDARGGFAYDLYTARMTSVFASWDSYLTKRLTGSLDYDYYAPTFDGDSIWNFFAGNPMNDVRARLAWDATDTVAFTGSGNVRVFSTNTAPASEVSGPRADPNVGFFPASGATFDGGASFAMRHRRGWNVENARFVWSGGKEGHRTGAEIGCEHTFLGRTVVLGRASVYDWEDRLRPGRDATSVGGVAGLGYRIDERARTQLEYQLDMNRLAGMRSRVVLWLTVAAR